MNYKHKYEKYKQRYLDLKQSEYDPVKIGGSATENNNIYVIVTGGTGTVGKALIQKLIKEKINVINIIRNKPTTNIDLITNISISDDPFDTDGLKSNKNVKTVLKKCYYTVNTIKTGNKDAKFFIVNSAADKDVNAVKKSMDESKYSDINYHWSIYFTQSLVEFAKELNIPLIHYSTVYVQKGESNDEWGIERKYVQKQDKPQSNDAYVYGYVKSLVEDIILDNYSSSFVIRLPGIIDERLGKLNETSPSNVVLSLLNKHNQANNIREEQILIMDNWQQKYPITAQIVAKFTYDIIDKIKDCNIIVGGIINLGGTGPFTKYELAVQAVTRYSFNYVKVKSVEQVNLSLPKSEKMLMINSNLPKCLDGMDYKNYKLEDPITKVLSACDKLVNDII